jgi:hypothetical protein
LFLPVDLVANPAINVFKSGRRFALEIKAHAAGGKTVYLYGNNYAGLYNLYSGITDMPQIEDEAKLRAVLEMPGVLVVSDGRRIDQVLSAEEKARHVVYREGVGHREMLLLKGMAPGAPVPSAAGSLGHFVPPRRLLHRAAAPGRASPLNQPRA